MKNLSLTNFKTQRGLNVHISMIYGNTQNFLLENGYQLEKCAFCENYAKVKIHWKIENEYYVIDNIEYPKGKYCCSSNCPGKKLAPMSKEFLKKAKGLTDEEVKEVLSKKSKKAKDTLHEKGWYDDISNNPFSKEYWIKKGYTEEEAQHKVNLRNKYTKEYWINKGYSQKEAIINSKQSADTMSLHSFERRYGKEKGLKKYKETVDKISNSLRESYKNNPRRKICFTTGGKSNEAENLFVLLEKFCIKYGIKEEDIFYNNKEKTKKEYWIKHKTDKVHTYFYDFVLKSKCLFIEYNGTRWHPDHRKQERLLVWKDAHTKEDYRKKLKTDLNKIKIVKKHKMKILVLWSSDGFDTNLNKAKNFIIENI